MIDETLKLFSRVSLVSRTEANYQVGRANPDFTGKVVLLNKKQVLKKAASSTVTLCTNQVTVERRLQKHCTNRVTSDRCTVPNSSVFETVVYPDLDALYGQKNTKHNGVFQGKVLPLPNSGVRLSKALLQALSRRK